MPSLPNLGKKKNPNKNKKENATIAPDLVQA
jgi:hypothetical protein